MATEARLRANNKYNKTHTKQFAFRFNLKTDADIIDHLLKQPVQAAYIKRLIREDIAK